MNEKSYVKIVESIVDFLNGLEALAVKLRRELQRSNGVKVKSSWNPSRISWQEAEGAKGKYERASDPTSEDFKALVQDLREHGDKLQRGCFFYWLFSDGKTVGRKRRVSQ